MNKTILYHLLAFLLLCGMATTTEAQVTIGSGFSPQKGSLLDLKQLEDDDTKQGKANATGGLLLPRVGLVDIASLKPCLDAAADANPIERTKHKGLLVYNVKDDVVNGLCPGVYLWQGDKWERVPDACFTLVSSIIVPNQTVEVSADVTATAAILPTHATDPSVTWSITAGGTFASIHPTLGVVRGLAAGNATIRATANDGSNVWGAGTVTVWAPIPVGGITITTPIEVAVDEEVQVTYSISPPTGATNKDVTWSITAGGDKASIDPATGIVTGKAIGTATIMATASDGSGVTATATVSVIAPKATGIIVHSKTVEIGKTMNASALVSPSGINGASQTVRWSITAGGDKAVVGATSGIIQGRAQGLATIRATTTDGSGVYGEATVSVVPIIVESITVTLDGNSVNIDEPKQAYAAILPIDATNKNVIWAIAPADIASIDSDGMVTGIAEGTATITATAVDAGNDVGTLDIEVKFACGSNGNPGTLVVGANTYLTYKYGDDCWMVTNSKEGTPTYTTYTGKAKGERGYYYAYAISDGACPENWILPTLPRMQSLGTYINANLDKPESRWWAGTINADSKLAGYYYPAQTGWYNWGVMTAVIASENPVSGSGGYSMWRLSQYEMQEMVGGRPAAAVVRCVKIK